MSARPVWTVERWKVVSKLKNQPNKKITLSNSNGNNSNTTDKGLKKASVAFLFLLLSEYTVCITLT